MLPRALPLMVLSLLLGCEMVSGPDAGEPYVDAGSRVDAGITEDAGQSDAGEVDAGEPDAGEVDAGSPVFALNVVTPGEAEELASVFELAGSVIAPVGLSSLRYELDGAAPIDLAVAANGAFHAQQTLSLGAHRLVFTAVDAMAALLTVTRDFTVIDSHAPVVMLEPWPAQTRLYDVTLRGRVSDDAPVALTFYLGDAGTPVTPDADGGFSIRFSPLRGDNDFVFVAADSRNQTRAGGEFNYGRRIAAGASHTLFAYDGGLLTWGRNNQGQLGHDGGTFSDLGLFLPGVAEVSWVSCGNNTSVALRSDGRVLTFGANGDGQLGLGLLNDGGMDVATRWAPELVPGVTNIVSVAAGYGHVLLLRDDGTLLAFGDNTVGQLGQTSIARNSVPTPVPGISDVVQIIGGSQHSAALKRDGTVWVWGRNQYGNLGQGTFDTMPHPTPLQVPGLSDVVQLASGRDHLVALKRDGTVWAWGLGGSAQLGQGAATPANSATPLAVLPLNDVVEVSANGNLTFALRSTGAVWAWGQGAQGALGVGDTVNKSAPTRVLTVQNVTDVAAGALHGFAIQNDGSVWAWGWNLNGTLGGGPSLQSSWAYTDAIGVVLP